MDAEIQELFNKLNDKMKEILLVENPDGNSEINFSKLSEAQKYATTPDEENALVELFLRQSIATDNKWGNVTMENIEPYKDVLIKLCTELGLKEIINPFLNFLPAFYNKNANASLTRDNMIDLNNLYAKDEITKEDLMGKGRNALDNILFNPELYKFENVDKMVEYWNWLREPNNLKKMNWQEIRNLNLTNAINQVADKVVSQVGGNQLSDEDWASFLNNIFYVNGQDGKINAEATLQKLLAAGSINSDLNKNTTKKKEVQSGDSYEDFKKALKNTINSKYKDLSADDISEIVADVIKELGVL